MQVSPQQEAMESLRQMFPAVERDVIRAVLEAHQWNEALAVDALLAITGENVDKPVSSENVTDPPPEVANSDGKTVQLHEDELLAKALQQELRKSDTGVVNDRDLAKSMSQLENDEALALSLQNELYLDADDRSRSTGEARAPESGDDVSNSEHGNDNGDKKDILDDISEGFDKAFDTTAKKIGEFGSGVSSVWSSFTKALGEQIDGTFKTTDPQPVQPAPNTPQAVVRDVPRLNKSVDEESRPFLQ